jgi:hypothetical protein
MTVAPPVAMRQVTANLPGNPIRAIEFAADGESPVRRVVTRSSARGTGKYPSWKMKRMLQWKSPDELNVLRLLDADPAVIAFKEQPARITYVVEGEERRHYPNVLVEWSGAQELWEIQPREEAVAEEVAVRTALMDSALPAYGYGYRLVFADEIAAPPALDNALLLLRFGRAPLSAAEKERIRRFMEVSGSVTWGAVLAGTLGSRGRAQVSRLVLEGTLTFDKTRPLTAASVLVLACEQGLLRKAA